MHRSRILLRLLPEYGGGSRIVNKLASGIPDLVVEVCRSSRSFDLGPKLAMYQRVGVPEYLAVLVEEQRFEWRRLHDGSYRIHPTGEDGIAKSDVFPGL